MLNITCDLFYSYNALYVCAMHLLLLTISLPPFSGIHLVRERERDSFIKHKINHGHFFHCPFLSFFLPFFPYISDAKGFFSLVDWQILKYTMFVGIGIPIPKSKRKK